MNTMYKTMVLATALLLFDSSLHASPQNADRNVIDDSDKMIHISIVADEGTTDTLTIHYWPEKISQGGFGARKYVVVKKNNEFKSVFLSESAIGRVSIYGLKNLVGKLENLIVEPGDRIFMRAQKSDKASIVIFTGEQTAKTECQYHISKSVQEAIAGKGRVINSIEDYDTARKSIILNTALTTLEGYKSELSTKIYRLIRADIDGEHFSNIISILRLLYIQKKATTDQKEKTATYYRNLIPAIVDTSNSEIVSLSVSYRKFLILKSFVDLMFRKGTMDFGIKEQYQLLKEQYSGILFDRLALSLLISTPRGQVNSEYEFCLQDALTVVKDEACLALLHKQLSAYGKNASAFPFALPDVAGNIVKLSDFRGKLVLIDFWFTNCPSCAHLAKMLQTEIIPKFAGKNIAFISIGLDKTKAQWLNSVAQGKYVSSSSVNLFTEEKAFEHPIASFYSLQGLPQLLLINPDGKVLNPNPPKNTEKLVALLIESLNIYSLQ